MQAGRLNETIEIFKPFQRKNEYGEVEDYFEKSFKTKSQVIYNSGNKIVENNEITSDYKLQFVIRIYHKISEQDRIKYDNKFYQIESIEKNKQFQLLRINASIVQE